MTSDGFFSGPLPRIFAHRGLALDAPENSIPAFAAALDAGATHLETDARATADGVAVLVHDAEVAGLPVAASTLAVLRGAHPLLCTLGEALASLPESRFNIDVKHHAAVIPVAEAVRAARASQRVLITSFSSVRRRRTLARLPGVATSASAEGVLGAVAGIGLRSPALVALAARGVQAFQLPERALRLDLTTPWAIAALRRSGAEVHVWVVNDPARMRQIVAHGADGIVTDRADLARDALR